MAKQNHKREDLIAGIIVSIIAVVVLFLIFKGSFLTDKALIDTSGNTSSVDSIYECSKDKALDDVVRDCNKESTTIALVNPNTNDLLAEVDLIKLIDGCNSLCENELLNLNAEYVKLNERNKKINHILLTHAPTEDTIDDLIREISGNTSPGVNDEFLFRLAGSDVEDLALVFDFVPIRVTISNASKDRHKVVKLTLADDKAPKQEKIEFGFKQNLDSFVSASQLKEKILTHFSSIEPAENPISYSKLRDEADLFGTEDISENSRMFIFVSANVGYPVIYSSGGRPSTVDDASCKTWHGIAYARNSAYRSCKASGEENCGTTYTNSYATYWNWKFKEPTLRDVVEESMELNIVKLYEDSWDSPACIDELKTISNSLF